MWVLFIWTLFQSSSFLTCTKSLLWKMVKNSLSAVKAVSFFFKNMAPCCMNGFYLYLELFVPLLRLWQENKNEPMGRRLWAQAHGGRSTTTAGQQTSCWEGQQRRLGSNLPGTVSRAGPEYGGQSCWCWWWPVVEGQMLSVRLEIKDWVVPLSRSINETFLFKTQNKVN